MANFQVWMRLNAHLAGESLAERFDFLVRQSGGLAAKSHEPHHTGSLQYPQAVAERQVHKDVAREERKIEAHAPVFPPPHRLVLRQISFDGTLAQLLKHAFFVVCASLRGI